MQQDTSLVNVLYALADGLLKLDAAYRESSSRIEERLKTFDLRLARLEHAQHREAPLHSDAVQGLPKTQQSSPQQRSPLPGSPTFTAVNVPSGKSDELATTLASMQKELQALRSRSTAPRGACPSVLSSSSNASRATTASDGALRTGLSSSTSSATSTLAGFANPVGHGERARDDSMQAPSSTSAKPRGSPPPKAHSPIPRSRAGKHFHRQTEESPQRHRSTSTRQRDVPQTEPKSARQGSSEREPGCQGTVDQLLMDVLRGGGGGGGGGGATTGMKHAKPRVDVSDWMASTS